MSSMSNLQVIDVSHNQISGVGIYPVDLHCNHDCFSAHIYNRSNYRSLFTLPLLTHVSGTVPTDLCRHEEQLSAAGAAGGANLSPLSDLFLGGNVLTGMLDLSSCINLIQVSAPTNNISDFSPPPSGYNRLHSIDLSNNQVNFGPG